MYSLVHFWGQSSTTPKIFNCLFSLTLSWRRPLPAHWLCKSMDWFLYDSSLHHERVKYWIIAWNCSVIMLTFIGFLFFSKSFGELFKLIFSEINCFWLSLYIWVSTCNIFSKNTEWKWKHSFALQNCISFLWSYF